jgi:hypothetical protein
VGSFKFCEEIEKMYRADGKPSPVTFNDEILAIIPIVNWFLFIPKVPNALNDFWASTGGTPAA